jgi:plastocyanin
MDTEITLRGSRTGGTRVEVASQEVRVHAPHTCRALTLLAAAGVLAVGCGGGNNSSDGGPTTSGAATPASGTAVAIDNFAFSPATLNVKMGQQVTWTNKQDVAHTVTADGGTFDHPMPPNATFSFTFPKAGSFAYHCTIHPFMKGTVVVS